MALAACAGDLSTLDPAGPSARSIATLWWVMLAGGTALFALTLGCLAVALFGRRRGGPGSDRWILWGGLVLPAVVLPALLVYALLAGERLLPHPGAALRIDAEARRWSWTFRYPDEPGRGPTVDLLLLPAGRPVEIRVTSLDVIHSFWIPRLGGKIDAIPGHTNTIRLQADRPGVYRAVCSEYCGTGHAGMTFVVEARGPEAAGSAAPGPRTGP